MKNIRLMAAGLFVLAFFSLSAFAQTAAQTSKVYVINTAFFADDKEGIKKFITASKQIETEFSPRLKELQTMEDKWKALGKEVQTLANQYNTNPNTSPIKPEAIQAKKDEFDRMEKDLKRKNEDFEADVAKREDVILNPIKLDIYKAMDEFARKQGYPIIFDLSLLVRNGLVVGIGDEKIDVTKEFITFYNTRPASAASATR